MRRFQPKFWFFVTLLLISGGFIHAWQWVGEAKIARQAFADFPVTLGSWQQVGGDVRFDEPTEGVLKADDYMTRFYRSSAAPDDEPALLYVGYYASQQGGATYHSPLNCLPGAGWQMQDGEHVTIASPTGAFAPFVANRYVIQNGGHRQILLYWYQGRGRAVANEYQGKLYTILDSTTRRRSDGALVRLLIPLRSVVTPADQHRAADMAADLAAQVAPILPTFVPN